MSFSSYSDSDDVNRFTHEYEINAFNSTFEDYDEDDEHSNHQKQNAGKYCFNASLIICD